MAHSRPNSPLRVCKGSDGRTKLFEREWADGFYRLTRLRLAPKQATKAGPLAIFLDYADGTAIETVSVDRNSCQRNRGILPIPLNPTSSLAAGVILASKEASGVTSRDGRFAQEGPC